MPVNNTGFTICKSNKTISTKYINVYLNNMLFKYCPVRKPDHVRVHIEGKGQSVEQLL